jgi:hypothetical protein
LIQGADFDCPRATRLKPLRRAVPLSDEVGQWKSAAWGNSTSASTTAQARTNPADIINSAIDALIRHDFELPPLATLRRLAGTAHSNINAGQWAEMCGRLSSAQQVVLETLLVVDPKTQGVRRRQPTVQKEEFGSERHPPDRSSRRGEAKL